MKPRTLLILVILGVIAIAGGWYFGTAEQPTGQQAFNAGKLMFPDLAPQLQNAARIEIVHQGKTTAIVKHGDTWGLEDRGGYVVQPGKLRGMLTALTELRLVEPRTTDPAEFSRLGLEDPNGKTAESNLLRVLDPSGKTIAVLIVGHRRVRTQGNVPEQVFVRRPDDNQTWLAEGSLQVDADPQLWLDRDIMNIDHTRIATVAVTDGDAKLELARDGQKLVMKQPADHPPLDDYKLDDVDRALELLTFQDVQTDKQPVGDKIGESVVHHQRRPGGDRQACSRAPRTSGRALPLRPPPARHRSQRQGQDGGGQVERAARRMDLSAWRLEAEGAGSHARRPEGPATAREACRRGLHPCRTRCPSTRPCRTRSH